MPRRTSSMRNHRSTTNRRESQKERSSEGASRARIRCAVYTRKSSEEGLEQEFNSLDAQREACEAFIRSQRHEGWIVLPELYDDPGFSGGTMDRPALQRLLADVAARKIEALVVYKVDRLTRSLSDFAKIVEIFDANAVSFVSVTQAFNTTTSMGRLTLNVLLSFAQFEREVTGERIRDKIAASKKKGLWMGGVVPLGYRLEEQKLYVNDDEAATVRLIFDLYLELGSIRALQRELKRRDIRTRVRTLASGEKVGGVHLTNGPLSHILRNRHYLGEINHHRRSWPGEHPAIIDPETFETVQGRLQEQRLARVTRLKSRALLRGKLFNEAGERLTPAYAVKGGVRYGYYVSTSAMQSRDRVASPIHRLPAAALETAVVNALRLALEEHGPQGPGIDASKNAGPVGCPATAAAQPWTSQFRSSDAAQSQILIDAHLVRVVVLRDRLEIAYRADPKDRSETETLSISWIKPAARVRRALLEPSDSTAPSRPMESDERNRLIRSSIASAR